VRKRRKGTKRTQRRMNCREVPAGSKNEEDGGEDREKSGKKKLELRKARSSKCKSGG
jgi:hypothetical protein